MPAAADNTNPMFLERRFGYAFTKHGVREYKKLKGDERKKLDKRLNDLCSNKWRELVNTNRERGLTPERKDYHMHGEIKGRSDVSHPENQLYPFHLRVPSISRVFRVFGYQYEDTFYITHIDPNHKKHRMS